MPRLAVKCLVGIALVSGAAADGSHPLKITSFSKYPGYPGALTVNGTVRVGQDGGDTQVFFYDLSGTDPSCGTANINGIDNACGVHVHAGTACGTAGGHYYSSSLNTDPWATISYTTSNNKAIGQNVRVKTGLALSAVEGRTFVVHDATGARVACAVLDHGKLITSSARKVKSFSKYPSYTGSFAVSGTMEIKEVNAGTKASQILVYKLKGVDTECGTKDISGVSNACGIHVHKGTNCSNATDVAGHYYDQDEYSEDPWKPIQYFSNSAGDATGTTIEIMTGTSARNITGRTMVVHDSTGARIACGSIVKEDQGAAVSHAPVAQVGSGLAGTLLLLVLSH